MLRDRVKSIGTISREHYSNSAAVWGFYMSNDKTPGSEAGGQSICNATLSEITATLDTRTILVSERSNLAWQQPGVGDNGHLLGALFPGNPR
jgi:hypothetical protein